MINNHLFDNNRKINTDSNFKLLYLTTFRISYHLSQTFENDRQPCKICLTVLSRDIKG